MSEIEVISSSLVKSNNGGSMSRLDLTPWDLQLLLLGPIQKGLLFRKPPTSLQTLINHLKNSLSRTLHFFPPLSGRLAILPNPENTVSFFVNCNDAGVEFVHASAGGVSVSDILGPTYIPKIVSSFFPLNGVMNCDGVSQPLLGVQVTELVDGVFIACSANHAVMDGISFWHFFNSWSEISRGSKTISKPPVFQPWFPPSLENRLMSLPPLEKSPLQNTPPALMERVFHFSRESIAELKAKTNYQGISSLQAVSAHLWRSTARARHSSRSSDEAGFMMVVGARGRLDLPDGYFGNAVSVAKMSVKEEEVVENGLGFSAMKIKELVGQQTREAVVEFLEDWVRKPFLHRGGSFSGAIAITSSPRHDVYGNDFGWGKPIAVRSGKGQKFDGKMTLFPSAMAAAIDVEVCLAPETLRAMEGDAEFIEPFFNP